MRLVCKIALGIAILLLNIAIIQFTAYNEWASGFPFQNLSEADKDIFCFRAREGAWGVLAGIIVLIGFLVFCFLDSRRSLKKH